MPTIFHAMEVRPAISRKSSSSTAAAAARSSSTAAAARQQQHSLNLTTHHSPLSHSLPSGRFNRPLAQVRLPRRMLHLYQLGVRLTTPPLRAPNEFRGGDVEGHAATARSVFALFLGAKGATSGVFKPNHAVQ